jgi:hypothetical protein
MSLPSTFSPHSDGGGTGSKQVHARFCLARAFAKVVLRANEIAKTPETSASTTLARAASLSAALARATL